METPKKSKVSRNSTRRTKTLDEENNERATLLQIKVDQIENEKQEIIKNNSNSLNKQQQELEQANKSLKKQQQKLMQANTSLSKQQQELEQANDSLNEQQQQLEQANTTIEMMKNETEKQANQIRKYEINKNEGMSIKLHYCIHRYQITQ